jgi:hypothetical protein
MPKWIPPLLVLFLAFFILSNPSEAGPQARSFFSWLGTQAGNAGAFLDGLFGEQADAPGDVPPGTGSGTDSFNSMANSMAPIIIDLAPVTARTTA